MSILWAAEQRGGRNYQPSLSITKLSLMSVNLEFKSPKLFSRLPSPGARVFCNAGDPSLVPTLGRSSGEGNGNPPQHSCLENPHAQRNLGATVHGFAKSWT